MVEERAKILYSNLRRRPPQIRTEPLGADVGYKPVIQRESNVGGEGAFGIRFRSPPFFPKRIE